MSGKTLDEINPVLAPEIELKDLTGFLDMLIQVDLSQQDSEA